MIYKIVIKLQLTFLFLLSKNFFDLKSISVDIALVKMLERTKK